MQTTDRNQQRRASSPAGNAQHDSDELSRSAAQKTKSMKERTGRMSDDVSATAHELADDAKSSASSLASDVADSVREAAQEQRNRGARSIEGVAGAARDVAHDLDKEAPYVARYVRRAADGLDDMSRAVRERSAGEIFGSVSDFARRQPATFFAGSILAGVIASRFLKSSAPQPEPRVGPGSPLPEGEPRSPARPQPRTQTRMPREPVTGQISGQKRGPR